MIVVDTNVLASLWVPNDMEEDAYRVLKKDPDWAAPMLWRSELRNVLSIYFRKDILDLFTIMQAMQEAEQLMGSHTFEVNTTQVFQFVNASSCSAYDCEFVALAQDLKMQLVTFDEQICNEFPEVAFHPEKYIK
jgi:predicted nucleic acid-binding protein